ncbi:hypothetical protein UNDYM_4512 [Undibacterium sp. YM2]|uniref:DUF1444 family protein n=1 Tax=Undibacterium sp. YM2 TaxID=2058625 RepID=UPI001331F1BF|nr:DUF1444 family protein [Undibacterium sp. YM2]BBB68765.1 hypothetical protein UNDYM_4512 [Undibacterium sp. YM2]
MNSFCSRAIAYVQVVEAGVIKSSEHSSADTLGACIQDLGNGLGIAYLVEDNNGYVFIKEQHLRAERWTLATLHQSAMSNLKQRIDRTFGLHDSAPLYGVFADMRFVASSMLLDDLWDSELSSCVNNGFIIAIPRRDALAFCDSQSEAGIALLKEVISRDLSHHSELISTSLYRRQNRRWVEIKTDIEELKVLELEVAKFQAWAIDRAESFREICKEHKQIDLSYELESVRWTDEYINYLRKLGNDDLIGTLWQLIGCFLGECLRRNLGGKWIKHYGSPGIRLENGNIAFPWTKVVKQFQNEPDSGDSILGFYTMNLAMNPRSLSKTAQRLLSIYEAHPDYSIFIPTTTDGELQWAKVKQIEDGWVSLDDNCASKFAVNVKVSSQLHGVQSFYVCNSYGELKEAEGISDILAASLPFGVHRQFVPANIIKTSLAVSELVNGVKFLNISFARSKFTQDGETRYVIVLRNISKEKIRVLRFGSYTLQDKLWKLKSATGNFSSDFQFREKYGGRAEWLEPEEQVSYSGNTEEPVVLWAYHCETEGGDKFIAGKILREVPVEELASPK